MRYLPVGGGAYHWMYTDAARRWFVTCDDLDTKPWLGSDRDMVFEALLAAYDTAMALRASGSAFVVAPFAARSGAPAERVDDRYSVSGLEYVEGTPGQWGRRISPRTVAALVSMLALLHHSTASVRTLARRGVRGAGPGRP
ncbi:MAG: hypothetical protein ACRD0U_02765 [Acidimicrobiales bacterium]